MTTATDIKYIVSDPAVYGGKPCIEGYRISVHDIAAYRNQGQTPEEIAADLRLGPAQVYAALTYYYDHQEQIDREIADEAAYIKRLAEADNSRLGQRSMEAMQETRRGSG